jgi:hypothetical protein
MRFVGRNQNGDIVRVSKLRKKTAIELIADDHPDLVAYRMASAAMRTPERRMRDSIVGDPFRKSVTKLMAAERGISNQEMVQLLVDQLQP